MLPGWVILFNTYETYIQWNLDLRKPDLRKNFDLRKIVANVSYEKFVTHLLPYSVANV